MFGTPAVTTHNIFWDFACVAVDNTALNVVCNQEYAQVVPHVRRPLYITSLYRNLITGRSTTT